MKPKTTIVLVILLVVVGLGVWLSKIIQHRAKDRTDSPAGKVFPHATGEAKKLTVENRDGTKLVFVHTNDRWNMIEPRLLPARADAVEPIVRMMTDLTYRRALSTEDSAAAPSETVTGLDRPRWTVTLTDPAERTCTLQVGSAGPNVGGDDETYVRAGEQGPVFVVPQNLGRLLQRDGKDYRDMAVLPEVRRDEVVAVRIQGRQNYTLRKNDGVWEVAQPFTARADASAVWALLTKLTSGLKARRFLTEAAASPTPYGLDRPQLVVTLTTKSAPIEAAGTQPTQTDKMYTLLLGSHRGKSICATVKDRPEVFTLPESMLDDLQPGLTTLLPKTALTFNPADVDRVQLHRKDEVIVLQRNGTWSMAQPFVGPVESGTVDELLHLLANLKIKSWIHPRPGQSTAPIRPITTFTLHLRNGKDQTLQVGNHSRDGGTVFCKPEDTAAVAAANAQNSEALYWPAVKFRSRTLLPIAPEADALGLTIDRPDGAYVLAKCDDAWTLAAPVTGRADAGAVQAILKTLTGLQASKIITLGESLPKEYAEAKDRITVSLTTHSPGDEPSRTWRLGVAKIGKEVFAWREGQPVITVGMCPASLYTTLTQPIQKADR